MPETLTKEQSGMWARSIVRDAPWTKPGWPTQKEIDAFFKTDFGKEVLRCRAEREAREAAEKTAGKKQPLAPACKAKEG